MANVKHNTPMKAYDHVSKLLVESGGEDGKISRSNADALVAKLNREGRGTEALAAQNVFTIIDARDAGRGNQVTGYDLKTDRAYVEAKLLKNRDADRNGFDRGERAELSPTGQALIELGQMLELGKVRGRVPHSTPEAGLFHVAGMIRQAAKADLITSRADADKYADNLLKQGRGAEALAFRIFFSFIDARDPSPNARITDADITRAVDYALEHLLANKDKDHNGYSNGEIDKFSTSAKAFLIIGRMIEAGIIESAMPTDGKGVQKALAKVIKGAEFDQMGSEGGQGLRAIAGKGSFDSVSLASFRKAFGIPKREFQVVEKFKAEDLRTFIQNEALTWKNGEETTDQVAAERAFASTAILRSLKDLKVFVAGNSDEGLLATYIVGIAPDKSMVGVQTGVVWT